MTLLLVVVAIAIVAGVAVLVARGEPVLAEDPVGARALAGPNGGGMVIFNQATGTPDYLGYIAIGTTVWMWQNVVLWNVGFALRDEQLRGTLESNWLSPTWRYSFLLGSSMTQLVTMCLFLAVSALEFWLFFGVRYHGNLGLALLVILAAIPSIYGLGIALNGRWGGPMYHQAPADTAPLENA